MIERKAAAQLVNEELDRVERRVSARPNNVRMVVTLAALGRGLSLRGSRVLERAAPATVSAKLAGLIGAREGRVGTGRSPPNG
ncbi:hypothetical protein [Streptacidiphilus sp. EB129]|uniref:hypothetical protein n=1 Tax=Streptacidiphilus sp. EB129 TaxID=3156262 RepID=UPI003517C449